MKKNFIKGRAKWLFIFTIQLFLWTKIDADEPETLYIGDEFTTILVEKEIKKVVVGQHYYVFRVEGSKLFIKAKKEVKESTSLTIEGSGFCIEKKLVYREESPAVYDLAPPSQSEEIGIHPCFIKLAQAPPNCNLIAYGSGLEGRVMTLLYHQDSVGIKIRLSGRESTTFEDVEAYVGSMAGKALAPDFSVQHHDQKTYILIRLPTPHTSKIIHLLSLDTRRP